MIPWLPLLKLWGYGSIILIAAGNLLAQLTFLHMAWRVGVPTTRRKAIYRTWITRRQSQKVLHSFQQADPASRLPLLNKLGSAATLLGLAGTVAWVITMCLLIVHLKG